VLFRENFSGNGGFVLELDYVSPDGAQAAHKDNQPAKPQFQHIANISERRGFDKQPSGEFDRQKKTSFRVLIALLVMPDN
jgi:hypothetical protein